MDKQTFENLYLKICSLGIFKNVLKTPVFQSYLNLMNSEKIDNKLSFYGEFINNIFKDSSNLTEVTKQIVFKDENTYIYLVSLKKEIPSILQKNIEYELKTLEAFATITSTDFKNYLGVEEIEDYDTSSIDLVKEYQNRLKNVSKYGYGIFASSTMFRLSDEKNIVPIISADLTSLSDFIGYDEERNTLLQNTANFMNNKPAFNTLLYGDAGTGKSSSVKAITNYFFKDGLRLIELRKNQICDLPLVMEKIRNNPLKFIIFIDDLSFNSNDDNFSMLKAILEGSASAKGDNALIYCTSNRRHLIKENFSAREEEDDLHRNDTMQETMSLVQRFGLTIAFYKPNKELYLQIVHELVQEAHIKIDNIQLDLKAEQFALAKGSRSPRVARQFVKTLM